MRVGPSYKSEEIIAVVDVGTVKVLCALGQYNSVSKKVEVLSTGCQAAMGMKKGQIVDLEAIESSIVQAVHTAEESAGERLDRVVVNLSGAQVVSEWVEMHSNVQGRPIQEQDLSRFIDPSALGEKHANAHVMHMLPLSYAVDDQRFIEDPRGMYGEKLKVNMHVITSAVSPMRNLITAFRRCHLTVHQTVVSGLAAGYATLVPDEMKMGVCVVDIGAGVTDIAVFHQGKCVYTDVILLAGNQITSDIAQVFSLSLMDAERFKILHGSGVALTSDRKERVSVPSRNGEEKTQTILKADLLDVIQARLEEIFELITHRLGQKGLTDVVNRRFVLTGGASQMPGIREFVSRFLQTQARLGRPLGVDGEVEGIRSPTFSTCAGLFYMALSETPAATVSKDGWTGRVGAWIKKNL